MVERVALARIAVRDLPVMADIGIDSHEIGRRQPLIVSVSLSVDAARADDIDATIDYRLIATAAADLGEQRIALIETFAHRLASHCLAFTGVRDAAVTVAKPQALPAGIASVTIALRRTARHRQHIIDAATGRAIGEEI